MVELHTSSGLVVKTTIPPGFGVIPDVRWHGVVTAAPVSDTPPARGAIEFMDATPQEYLERWMACNEVFGDKVELVSVIRWSDGLVSFAITQPQYHGIPAEPREIERFFNDAGWVRLKDPSGHAVFFNHAFGVMAIDAEKRNCYVNEWGLQPFDVILRKPDEQLDRFLGIHPDA